MWQHMLLQLEMATCLQYQGFTYDLIWFICSSIFDSFFKTCIFASKVSKEVDLATNSKPYNIKYVRFR